MSRGHVTLRLTAEELTLLQQGLDALEGHEEFTQRVQPPTSAMAVQAATRVQAISMLRSILQEAR